MTCGRNDGKLTPIFKEQCVKFVISEKSFVSTVSIEEEWIAEVDS